MKIIFMNTVFYCGGNMRDYISWIYKTREFFFINTIKTK